MIELSRITKSLMLTMLVTGSCCANVFDAWDNLKERTQNIRRTTNYYTPYVTVPVAGFLTSLVLNKKIGYGAAAIYAGYSALSGMYTVYSLKKKYQKKERTGDGWHAGNKTEPFYFARWRQKNEGDGIYWTTAWQMQNNIDDVKAEFVYDLYAGKFVVVDQDGQQIAFPTPEQVLVALRAELEEVARDREALEQYTNVYYAKGQPEEFHPDTSWKQLLWPNYNGASYLYIELDVMLKRLEKIIDVLAQLRASVGGQGWPKPPRQRVGRN